MQMGRGNPEINVSALNGASVVTIGASPLPDIVANLSGEITASVTVFTYLTE